VFLKAFETYLRSASRGTRL